MVNQLNQAAQTTQIKMNNNLIIFYKDKSKDIFSFNVDTTEERALEQFQSMRPDVKGTDIKKYFYFQNDDTAPNIYGKYGKLAEEKDNKMMKVDYRRMIIDRRLEEVRTKRDTFLNRLDIPFMRSLEEKDGMVKNHIIALKDFLRDLPQNLLFNELKDHELITYSPFGNIFEILIVNGGEGYVRSPKVTVDNPNAPNVTAKATAFIRDGKVSKIKVTDYGCGYNFLPKITIEAPENGKAAFAVCPPPQNVLLSNEDLKENTKKRYLTP